MSATSATALNIAIAGLWAAWLIYWWVVAARNVKTTAWRESLGSQAKHRVPLIAMWVLFGAPTILPAWLRTHLWRPSPIVAWPGVTVLAAGLAFSVWARVVLGRNWSATVTLKTDHTLVQAGPYRFVRHPVYTGVLTGLVGTAIAIDERRAIVAVALGLLAFVLKLRTEEQLMAKTFPEYAAYRARTAALVPKIY